MSRRAAILIFVGSLVLIDALARFVTGSSPSIIDEASPVPSTPTTVVVGEGLRDEFGPLLARAANHARVLVELGERKDRNLLRIRAGQDAMEQSLGAADDWLAQNPGAEVDAASVAAYRLGATRIRVAMAEAQEGLLRLDFDRVARATATMREGERLLGDAQRLLEPKP
jgi:hypothetical protein